MLQTREYSEGLFVFLYPTRGTTPVHPCLTDMSSSLSTAGPSNDAPTEEMVDAIRRVTGLPWADAFFDCYLNFSKLE